MIDCCAEPDDLVQLAIQCSRLPLILFETGGVGETSKMVREVIFCTSISPLERYAEGMPRFLTLARKLADGQVFSAEYAQQRI